MIQRPLETTYFGMRSATNESRQLVKKTGVGYANQTEVLNTLNMDASTSWL